MEFNLQTNNMFQNTSSQKSAEIENDPFLCHDCQSLGYCRKRRAEANKKQERAASENEISQWVPLKTRKNNGSQQFFRKVQQAHDLFHQEEFEGASYMYRDLFENRIDSVEIIIGLAASLYFLKEYDEAAALVVKLPMDYYKFPERFINLCLIKEKEKREREKEIQDELLKEVITTKKEQKTGSKNSVRIASAQNIEV